MEAEFAERNKGNAIYIDEVYPRLYMSGWEAHANREHLLKIGITHVV
jgi:hypothetical protein